MVNWPILSLITFLPLIGSMFIFFIKGDNYNATRNTRNVALLSSISCLVIALSMVLRYNPKISALQLTEQKNWIDIGGYSYKMGIDGFSVPFIIISALIGVAAVINARKYEGLKQKEQMIAVLFATSMANGIFCSADIATFNVFFFLFPLPFIFLSGLENIKKTPVLQALLFPGILIFPVVVIIHAYRSSESIPNSSLPTDIQNIIFFLMFLALSMRMSLFPFHNYLPSFLENLSSSSSILYPSIAIQSGVYGFLRFVLPITHNPIKNYLSFLEAIALIAIIYCAMCAFYQKKINRFCGYFSGVYSGIIFIALLFVKTATIKGAIITSIAYSLVVTMIILMFSELNDEEKSEPVKNNNNTLLKFLLTALVLALPASPFFVGIINILSGLFKESAYFAGFIILFSIMILSYRFVVILYNRKNIDFSCKTTVFLMIISFIIGIYPKPIIKAIDASIADIKVLEQRYD